MGRIEIKPHVDMFIARVLGRRAYLCESTSVQVQSAGVSGCEIAESVADSLHW